ncbi:hypothetical protein E2C01_049079 [Portunus trituberculatus]|uniref:Uncharacterized protein n=1 Tax=Portunus trituberculatus TaxID=210409 RepID=A0A5B7GD92_PORTR|nr:hypothetical protein [Portunus trituberculatus]
MAPSRLVSSTSESACGPSSSVAAMGLSTLPASSPPLSQVARALHLHAWRLSSVSSEREAFCRRLLDLWPFQSNSPLPESIRQSGSSSVVGVSRGVVFLSRPL